MKMRPFGKLLDHEVARSLLMEAVAPIDRIERIPIERAVGRVLARRQVAPAPVPSFDRATWDGYALASRDTRTAAPGRPVGLTLVGEVFAEGRHRSGLRKGEAVEIATGGALPKGADAVLIFEEARRIDATLWVPRPLYRDERVARAGDDFPKGTVLARPGNLVTPAVAGAIASTGRAAIDVFARPTVAILPNGNELVQPGGRLGRGQIYESNNAALSAVVEAAGGIPRPLRPIPDRESAIESALRRALRTSDLVLATGGSSVGEHDYLPKIFPRLGRLLFHGIAVRPGKPTLAAAVGRKVVIGMPGHPTSCLLNGYWLLLPVLRRLARLPGPGWTEESARLSRAPMVSSPALATVVPLRVARGIAHPTFHDSSAITSLSGATAFIIRAAGSSNLRASARVMVRRLPESLAGAAP